MFEGRKRGVVRKVRFADVKTTWTFNAEEGLKEPVVAEVDVQVVTGDAGVDVLYPAYLALLGAATFLLYTAHYLADLGLVYLTFVPGTLVEWWKHIIPQAIRIRLNPLLMHDDRVKALFILRSIPTAWRTLLGSNHELGSGYRFIDKLLVWSFTLDMAALTSGVLLVFAMWLHGKQLRRWRPSLVGFVKNAFRLRNMASSLTVAGSIVVGYPVVTQDFTTFVAFIAGLSIYHLWITFSLFSRRIPPICQWQLLWSALRLRHLDPYRHQPHFLVAMSQLVFLTYMLGYAGQASEYYQRVFAHHYVLGKGRKLVR